MKNLIYFFANNRMLVNIIIFVSIMLGLYSYYNIDKESFPSTDLELMILQVVYPGASPLDVEQNAVIQIEDQLRTISGIDEFTSIITENAAIIFVQLDMEIDTSKAKDDIFRKMQSVPDMAEEVETIEITDINPKLTPIYNIGVHFKKGYKKYAQNGEQDIRGGELRGVFYVFVVQPPFKRLRRTFAADGGEQREYEHGDGVRFDAARRRAARAADEH